MALDFDRSLTPHYGETVRLSERVARLLARNPGPFTFLGTGVHIVGSGASVAVIDPGPDDPAHLAALKSAIEPRRVSHILITHTHQDHSPAAAPLKAWSGAPTYGYDPFRPSHAAPAPGAERQQKAGGLRATDISPANALRARRGGGPEPAVEEGVDMAFVPDVQVRDGDVIAGAGFTLECVHTPGHTANHMCYALMEENSLFSGDHVMGWSTSVIAPPDGDMGDYLASLEKLLRRNDAIYYPTHGSPISAPGNFVAALITHRRMRAAQIRSAIRRGEDTIPLLVARLYADVAPALRKAAALTVQAHLEQMLRAGDIAQTGGRWSLT